MTGVGGAGKTRLALRVATAVEQEFDGNVFFVDLAPITNPALVPVTVARALELTDQPGCTTLETIHRFITDRKVLVVLDNCEHLLDACSEILTDILHAGDQVTVLATSRETAGDSRGTDVAGAVAVHRRRGRGVVRRPRPAYPARPGLDC